MGETGWRWVVVVGSGPRQWTAGEAVESYGFIYLG
jgi:hypothetical protein